MIRKIKVNNRGESLVMVLISVIVLAVFMLGIAETFLRAVQNNGSVAGVTELMNISEQTCDAIMALSDAQIRAKRGGPTQVNADTDLTSRVKYYSDLYSVTFKIDVLTIALNNNVADDHTVKVTVTTQYTEGHAKTMGIQDVSDSTITSVFYRTTEP